jgi:hypothetical protein
MTDWHALIAAARRRGECLAVIDLARQALEEHPGDLLLEYEKALAYARAGAIGEAEASLAALATAGALDAIADPALRRDFAALRARLLKDRGYAASGAEAIAWSLRAAAAYEEVYRSFGDSFTAINAATLTCIAGDHARAGVLAQAAITAAEGEAPGYWRDATIGEARLLLGDVDAAAAAFRRAVGRSMHLDELATTRRQVAWLLTAGFGRDDAVAALPVPTIVAWEAAWSDGEPGWELAPIRRLADRPESGGLPVLAYGAIISPADVVIAEAFNAVDAQTDLVIASTRSACVEAFGRRFGEGWATRLDAALTAAQRVTEVTLEGDSSEPTVAQMARQQASGLAAMRASALVARVEQLRFGDVAGAPLAEQAERVPRFFVFGDVKGFSTITEAAHRPFLDCVIGGFADVLGELGSQVEYVETAGDGIFAVLSSVTAALRCCHGLQLSMLPDRLEAAGLPRALGLRLGAHAGPVGRGLDRVTGREKFIGKEVIRTARIEAVTPVGVTYVTEQFAAMLHALTTVGHACECVGWQAMAKGFGRCRMYSLKPTAQLMAMIGR